MQPILNTELGGNRILDWLLAVAVVVCVAILLHALIRIGANHLKRLAGRPGLDLFDLSNRLLQRTHSLFVIIFAVYVSTFVVRLGATETHALEIIALSALLLQVGLWLDGAIVFYSERSTSEPGRMDSNAAATIRVLGVLGRLVLWTVFLLLILSNAGVDISALVAALGITGVAAALAVQTLLRDLLASFSIMLDKPFLVGHYIVVGDYQGTVEKIGLKTTHLRSLSGEQIVFSNQDIVESRVRNYKRMETRRVAFSFMVDYQTPLDMLTEIPAMVREIVERQNAVRFDRAHFKEYSDFGLVFEVVYHVLSADYTLYMDIQQAVNLALYEKFQQEGIAFAYVRGAAAAAKAFAD